MDEWTEDKLKSSVHSTVIDTAFDNIIISKEKFKSKKRKHFDSPWYSFTSLFNNQNRILSYQYTPYDETILIDTDYIIMNDNLDSIWGNSEPLLMNRKALNLHCKPFGSIEEKRLSQYGIPMYWATLVYFQKTEYTKIFFDLLDYIRKEYNFFQFLYGFNGNYFRNDFVFSIAAHMLNGFYKDGVRSFPEDYILTEHQKDSIAKIKKHNEIIFLANHIKEPWKNTLVNIKEMNVHIMNKKDFISKSEQFIDLCMEMI